MNETKFLLAIGVNTGNSLDAADVVLTKFGTDSSITDLDALSVPMPAELGNRLRLFRAAVVDSLGDMNEAIRCYAERAVEAKLSLETFDKLVYDYTHYVSGAINELVQRATKNGTTECQVDLIGFHGQTCAHQPPSIAREAGTAYTLQIGNGQQLADETGLLVVYDFRSDDLMNGGEAAPLAPMHHQHLANHLKERDKFPIAFCNAGNTGNISVITDHPEKGVVLLGWDAGPFNDYPDKLMQIERSQMCDLDGVIGNKGHVNLDLLRLLFERGAVTDHGENYLLQPPPKSSDPQWYRLLPELMGEAPVGENILSFEDRLRTAEYFAAYVYFYSLHWIPSKMLIPTCFALCGGGWNNPVSRRHFEQLLNGDFEDSPVLPEHRELFNAISERLRVTKKNIEVAMADEFGFSGQFMEARLFADAAVCRIRGEAFSLPETTGCKSPTVLGILRFPQNNPELASERLKDWLSLYGTANLMEDNSQLFDGRWSRAARGWNMRLTASESVAEKLNQPGS